MNIARLFSYTQQLEKRLEELRSELEKERNSFNADKKQWEEERKIYIDRLLHRNGVQPINKPLIPQQPETPQKPLELPRVAANRKAKEIELATITSLKEAREAARQAAAKTQQ